jgi:hypothetical protein
VFIFELIEKEFAENMDGSKRSEFESIGQDVEDNLLNPVWITHNPHVLITQFV